ncbi:MAG: lytic transglycosylase domain-containing protein [Rhodovulum sp.]
MALRLVLTTVAAVALALPGAAEPPPWPDFTFKRVKPPVPGAPRRITVQVQPVAPRAPVAPPPAAPADTPESGPEPGWFWARVSPALADGGPGRLAPALAALANPPLGEDIPAPRLQQLQDIAARHGTDILLATVGTRVSPALALAVIGVESSGRSTAVSPKGATGLMQLMPATATRFGVSDLRDPAANIRGGVAYLDWLMREFGNDPVLVLAAYNAGEGAVRNHAGVPPYAETRDYVPKVLAAWAVARGLCQTPPELISDGCVFRVMGAG